MRISIRGGHFIDPANKVDDTLDLHIADGRVVALGTAPDGFQSDREIDAEGLVVCPGFVDLCARLREPGAEHKGSIESETRAAVSGGITTVCVPPDTDPVIDDPSVVELIRRRQRLAGQAKVVMLGALTRQLGGEFLSEMGALMEAGCVGVSNAWVPVANPLVMRRALEYAATFDLTVFSVPYDPLLAPDGCAHEGETATRLGLPGVPRSAETTIVARDLALIEETGVRAHFCRLSAAHSVDLIERAIGHGLPVTADVCAHQLYLTDRDVGEFDSRFHLRPPLRTDIDRQRLLEGVRSGSITAVCSDHQPHDQDAKLHPFSDTEPGASTLETLLPLTLALRDHGLDLNSALERITCAPARILRIEAGTLGLGAAADVCLFEPDTEWVVESHALYSNGRNTPLDGRRVRGRVKQVLVDGRSVFEAG